WLKELLPALARCGSTSAIDDFLKLERTSIEGLSQLLFPSMIINQWHDFTPPYEYDYFQEYRDDLITILLNSSEPNHSLILLNYIYRVPTPENRALLTDMTWNSDPVVQKRVADVKAELETLKTNMPELPFKENNETGDMTK
ncbi:hypothetical protein BVX99_01245, partial [bacterium F16]